MGTPWEWWMISGGLGVVYDPSNTLVLVYVWLNVFYNWCDFHILIFDENDDPAMKKKQCHLIVNH